MWPDSSISAKAGRRSRNSRATRGCVGLKGAPGNGPNPVIRMRSFWLISPQHARNLLGRQYRRDAAVSHLGFDLFHLGTNGLVRTQPRHHALLQHRPHPFDLLLAPPRREFARGAHRYTMVENFLPKRVDARARQRRIGEDRRMPVL